MSVAPPEVLSITLVRSVKPVQGGRRRSPLVAVELQDRVEGSALLAEALADVPHRDLRRRRVLQAYLVPPVVVLWATAADGWKRRLTPLAMWRGVTE